MKNPTMKTTRPRTTCTLLLAILIALLPGPAPARVDPGQFLLISDIHFDPFYDGGLFDRLRDQPVEAWAGILEGSRPAGLNPMGTDSNYALLKSSLDDAVRRLPDPDFILYPGDLLAHQWQGKYDARARQSHLADPAAYRAFTTKAIRFLAGEFRRRYPATPVLPTMGNDDSYCGDYRVTPDGPFLAMFAEIWAPLIGPEGDAAAFKSTFPREGCFTLRLPRTKTHRLVVLNSVFFSVNYDNSCGSSTQTPALEQIRWLDRTLGQARAAGEAVWLLMHVPPGINSYNSADSVARGGPPVTFWQPELTGRFLQLLREHGPTIQAAFLGHTHMDDFRVIRLDGKPALLGKIAPAISPIFGNNPGYQVYQYDRESGALRDFQTYHLTDLPAAGRPSPPGSGTWSFEYDFRGTYGFPTLDANAVEQLANRMKTDPALQQRYTRFYGVGAAPQFAPQAFEIYRCAIANVNPAEFLTCISGVPTPGRPELLPDRKPRAESAKPE